MDSKLVQQHDDVYAAVFSLVGQKPNETYEGLVKVLPSIKDADPAEVKELEAKKALREMLKPQVDPLRLEYEKAAAEDDVEDLSTEEGDWLGVSKTGEDDEELDENGIPMMKLSRASSSFILDGPGDVKVDNFTPEGDDLDDGNGNHDGATDSGPATTASASKPTDSGAAAAAAAASPAPATAAPAGYVPSVIARSRRSASGAGAAATAPATAVPAAREVGTVMTLEDEIRAMRGAAAGAGTCSGAPSSAALAADPSSRWGRGQEQEGGTAEPGRRQVARTSANEDVDEDAVEVVPEPPGALLLRAPGSGPAPVNGGAGEGRVSVAVTTAAAAAAACAVAAPLGGRGLVPVPSGAEGQVDLPGTCLDTRHEDSLWAAMQGVDGLALLEHLGLAGPPSATVGDITPVPSAEQPDPGRADGEGDAGAGAGAAAVPQAAPPALANGHHVDEGAAAVGGAVARRSGSGSGGPGGGDGEGAIEAAGASAADGDAVAAAAAAAAAAGGEVALVAAGGAGCRPAPAAAAVAARSGAPPSSSSADEPTFEEVESFKLDPDFDYDNVQLTVREFPYSMMGVRVPR